MHDSKLEDKPYRCEYSGCKAAFIHHSALKTHSYTHSGERPYQCEYRGCDASFAHPSNLATHKRIHTGEKPYVCKKEGCKAAFAQSSNLTRHIRSHTKQKPYVCEVCKARYSSVRSRSRHMLTHDVIPSPNDTAGVKLDMATGGKRSSVSENEIAKTEDDDSKDDDGAYTRVDDFPAVVPSHQSKRQKYSISHPYAKSSSRAQSDLQGEPARSSRRAHLLYGDENTKAIGDKARSKSYPENQPYNSVRVDEIGGVVQTGRRDQNETYSARDRGVLRMSIDSSSAMSEHGRDNARYTDVPLDYETKDSRMSVDSVMMPSARTWSVTSEQHSNPRQSQSHERHRFAPPAQRESADVDARAISLDSRFSSNYLPSHRQRSHPDQGISPDSNELRAPMHRNASGRHQYSQPLTQAQIHAQAKADARARGRQHLAVQSSGVVEDSLDTSPYPAPDDKWARLRRATKKHRDSGVDLDEDMEIAQEICARHDDLGFQRQQQHQQRRERAYTGNDAHAYVSSKYVGSAEASNIDRDSPQRAAEQWGDREPEMEYRATIQSPTHDRGSHSPHHSGSAAPLKYPHEVGPIFNKNGRAHGHTQDQTTLDGKTTQNENEALPQHRSSLNMLVEVLQSLVKS